MLIKTIPIVSSGRITSPTVLNDNSLKALDRHTDGKSANQIVIVSYGYKFQRCLIYYHYQLLRSCQKLGT